MTPPGRISTPGQGTTYSQTSRPLPNIPTPFAAPASTPSFTSTAMPANQLSRRDTIEGLAPKGEAGKGQALPRAGTLDNSVMPPRNVTSRALPPAPVSRFTGPFPQDASRVQSPLRTRRLISDSRYGEQVERGGIPYSPQQPSGTAPHTRIRQSSLMWGVRLLLPGSILHGGRYRVLELRSRQEWAYGAFEAMWIGQDAQRGGSQVMIWEVVLPEMASSAIQARLRAATMALASISRHPRVPTLSDAFSDQERTFFVFEPIAGESLLARMHRTGRALPEQDVIECCLQITEVLELLSQQMPPLVHGLIRPEHIIAAHNGSIYTLTNFSVVLMSGATQFITGIERSRLSPYTAPELIRGVVDGRSDLYSLVATAYHVITGSIPTQVDGNIPQVQRLNPNISAQFNAILAKGLRPIASQRYQRPAELLYDLQTIRSASPTLPRAGSRGSEWRAQAMRAEPPMAADSVAQALPIPLTPAEDLDVHAPLLPSPEELPPLGHSNDTINALVLFGILLVCIFIIVLESGRAF
jgi:serine/threonine protein kinase